MGNYNIQPFKISVEEKMLHELKAKLKATKYSKPLFNAGDWTRGTPPSYLKELVDYWHDTFDWRKAEKMLNSMPQFTADIGDCKIHFVHKQGKGPNPIPLVFSHGFPGSFFEVSKILGPLTDPAAYGGDPKDAFHVVAPSLVGYGFSPHPGRPGIGPYEVAAIWAELMTKVLGYEKFVAQGGDWGSAVTAMLGRHHTDVVMSIHLNRDALAPILQGAPPLTAAEQKYQDEKNAWSAEEGAYGHEQGTKPSTIGSALSDSPAGLAAWIVEKFHRWTDWGNPPYNDKEFTKDELLTNIMIYWVSNCIATAQNFYYETRHGSAMAHLFVPGKVEVPTGYACLPNELPVPPKEWIERGCNLVRFDKLTHGGHFAALENPTELVESIRATFRPLRKK